MNELADPLAKTIDGQAREWFVRLLDEDVPERELDCWRRWIEADHAHERAYSRVIETWRLAGQVQAWRAGRVEPAARRDPSPRRARPARRPSWLLAGAAAAAAVTAVLVWTSTTAPPPVRTFATMRAEHLSTRLVDGSAVRLGGMTSLEVAYGPKRRAIRMARGEALFQVAHDRARPFVVGTPLAEITAVGTAFNIDVAGPVVTLDVSEGLVRVALGAGPDRRSVNVAAGQRLRLDGGGPRLVVQYSQAPAAPSWSQGRLEYRNEPLRTVIADINRYVLKPIVLDDPTLGDLSYTGAIQLEFADAWVEGLPGAFPISVGRDRQGQVVVSRNPSQALPESAPRSS